MKRALVLVIRIYQRTLSKVLGSNCRFYPTCSEYAVQAISKHGSVKGGWLAIKRISRCHPLHQGGIDEVP